MSGCFCFISDDFFEEFPDKTLMKNKEKIDGVLYSRPCFFAFHDLKNPEILWLIPVSSQIEKYKRIQKNTIDRFGFCNKIYICNFIGVETAFLLQNMFPITKEYIAETYNDRNTNSPIRIRQEDEKKIIRQARNILKSHKMGKYSLFADIDLMKEKLLKKEKRTKVSDL